MKVMVIHLGDPPEVAETDPGFVEERHGFYAGIREKVTILGGHELHGTAHGRRVRFLKGKQVVIDGPFTEAKEVVAGYSVWEVESMDQAVEIVKGIPQAAGVDGGEIEIREVHVWDG